MSKLYAYLEGEMVNEAKIGHCTYYGIVEAKYPQYIPNLIVEDSVTYWIVFIRPYFKRIIHYRGNPGLNKIEAVDLINTVIKQKPNKRTRINKENLYRKFQQVDVQKDPEHYSIEVDHESKSFRYLRSCEHLFQKLTEGGQAQFDYLGISAIKNLLEIGDERALSFLFVALNSTNKMIWFYAAQGIIELIPKLLIERLKHENSYIRSSTASVIGKYQIQGAPELLLQVIKEDSDDLVRYEALKSLRLIGGEEIIQPILGLLEKESNEWILSEAIRAYLSFGDKVNMGVLKKLKEHPNRAVRDTVEKYLVTTEGVEGKALLTTVVDIDREQRLQSQALKTLREINNPSTIKILFAGLSDGHREQISHIIGHEIEKLDKSQQ